MFEEDSFSPIAKIKNDKHYSIVNDHLGTPYESYDDKGALIWERQLNANGKIITQKGIQNFCPFLYQGQSLDNEIELAYNRFRYYDVEDGRYISQDPIGLLSEEFNFYAYVDDSNLYIDELGLYKSAYRKRSKASVKKLRDRFNNKVRKKFIKKLAKDENSLKARGFSDADIEAMKKGDVPTGYVVHHKKPLYRGGNNSYDNLELMKESDHSPKGKYGPLHDYPEGQNPFGAKYN